MPRTQKSGDTRATSSGARVSRRLTTGGDLSLRKKNSSAGSCCVRRRKSLPTGSLRSRTPACTSNRAQSSVPCVGGGAQAPALSERTPSPRGSKRSKPRLSPANRQLPGSRNICEVEKPSPSPNAEANGGVRPGFNGTYSNGRDAAQVPSVERRVPAAKQEENLTLSDVEELRRRREQLRYGVDTSLARIAELQLLTQAFCLEQGDVCDDSDGDVGTVPASAACNDATGDRGGTPVPLATPVERKKCEAGDGVEEALMLLQAAEEEYKEMKLQLTLACAALSAVPQSLWSDIRRFRQPPPAVAAVMDAVSILLGLPQSRHRKMGLGNGRWPDFPQQLIMCEPLTAYREIMGFADCESWMRCSSRMEELEHFLCQWNYLRVSRVHPTLGPLYRWVKTMVDASRAAGKLKALRDASNAREVGTVTDGAALLRELRENEEYVQLAQEEIMAIDALVADVVAFGVAGSARRLIGSGRETIPLDEPLKGCDTGRPGGCNRPARAVKWSEGSTSVNVASPSDMGELLSATGVVESMGKEAIVPALNFASCLPLFPHVEQGPLSLRERFERIRTSSLCHSPRAGPIAHFDRSVSGGNIGGVVDLATSIGNTSVLTTARVLRDRENLLTRVHQLEEQLNDICGSKPDEVELVLLRDELKAAQQEINKLREERDELEQRVRRHEIYYKGSPPRTGCSKEVDDKMGEGTLVVPGDVMTIMTLEQQLKAAHTRIQQLEATVMGLTSDEGTHCTSVSGSGQDSPETPCNVSEQPSVFAACDGGGSVSGSLGDVALLQRRIEELQESLEFHRHAFEGAEERLNEEIHAKNVSCQQVRQLQTELRSVWRRLESTEYQLKVAIEDSRCHYCRAEIGERESECNQYLRHLREREVAYQEEIERLQMQLSDQKARSVDERRRRVELRKIRTAFLFKLEKTFSEALQRHEGSARRVSAAFRPNRLGESVMTPPSS